jgi:hypothetical protein
VRREEGGLGRRRLCLCSDCRCRPRVGALCKPIAYRCAVVGQPWARHYVTHSARARVRGSGGGQGQGGHEDVPLHVTCADRCHA